MGTRRIGHAVAALLLGLVLAGQTTAATALAQPETPVAGSPEALVRQLLTTPFSVDAHEVAGSDASDGAVVAVWNDPASGFLDETVGAVQVIFPSLPYADLGYRVYRDETAAAAALRRDTTEHAPVVDAPVSTPEGFDGHPATLIEAGDESICLVQIDNVLVTARAEDGDLPPGTGTVALAAILAGHLDNVLSGSLPVASPSADGPLAGTDPWMLYDRLLVEPFAMNELPAGFTDPVLEAWTDYNDDDLRGVVGGVLVYSETDELTGIAYMVYPNQDAADYFYALNTGASIERGGTPAPAPADALDVPATVISYDDYVVCIAQVGYVTVIGAADGGDADQAIALAAAGVKHVERVATS